ncbi:MAG: hypothetical protein P8P35_09935 [Planktotalea sp.]|uniref:hypothetical protein n=1 Tax=Planktotalea sp. TaxID=2029877 RepID=UPI0026046EF4|nr:hypothetical protein [Planktotalea sp.]MDG1084407.1 hypothetical protein [Planktotalea sp.]
MVNSSKVLTVSYGTFSCTLEGFDDSFDTMKAIAEYFRDLAADDRYFGAEPPTPDADMLARIAEREVSRRVEAHQDGGNIVLRTALPAADVLVADTNLNDADAETEALEQARLAEITEQEAEAERLRGEENAKQAEAAAKAEAAEQQKLQLKAEEDARLAKEAKKAKAEAARLAQEEADALVTAEADAKAEAEAQRHAEAAAKAEAEEAASLAAEDLAKQAQDEQPEPDSVAAKLARIRAVVGQPVDTPATSDFSEDEHADDIMQGQPGDTDLEDILELDDAPASIDMDAAIGDDNDDDAVTKDAISGVMAKLSADIPVDTARQEMVEDIEFDIETTDLSDAIADFAEVNAAPVEAEVPQDPPKAPIRARVIKMKREEFEAAIASGDIEEDDDDGADTTIMQDAAQDTSLSRDDEDELARELAAVEAELAGLPAEDSYVEEEAFEPVQDLEPAHSVTETARGLDDLAPKPDLEMDRLMDQASSELEEPDGKKRRNALGHLRAAVASARADKKSNPNDAHVDETLDYRDDLESAVQPRRPVRRLSASDTTASTARPPLKLVAEQRVDSTTESPVATTSAAPTPTPVRPRRIRAGMTPADAAPQNADLAPEGGNFNEFAEEMGATELPDLLEAAAAYLAFVEGKEQFSRPQLMTKVRMVQEDNFSREDGLRSFGQLLRQGKIEKISGGRFAVSDRISFKPDTRAVG